MSLFDEIKERIPMMELLSRVGVESKKKGSIWLALCPFHTERTPSFTIYENKRGKCFGCGWQGDVLKFWSDREGLSLSDAAASLIAFFSLNVSAPRNQKDDNAERSRRLMEAREKAERATASALKEWRSAKPLVMADTDYFRKKRITMMGCAGLRVIKCALLVPVWRDGEVISTQKIAESGEKRFAPGAPVKGGVFWLERPRAAVTILAEGFATAATVFEAVNHSRVCVTFSAENMIEVATRLDWQGMCAVAGDNDHRQPCPWCLKRGEHLQNPPTQPRPEQCRCNPGHSSALAAAKIIGCGVAIPPAHDEVTDFNDWFAHLLATREKLAEIAPRPPSPSRLRKAALAYVSARIMGAAKKVG